MENNTEKIHEKHQNKGVKINIEGLQESHPHKKHQSRNKIAIHIY